MSYLHLNPDFPQQQIQTAERARQVSESFTRRDLNLISPVITQLKNKAQKTPKPTNQLTLSILVQR